MESTESDFSEEIFGVGKYEASFPQKKNFLPWHKPRKQFVRHHQWREQIDLLLKEYPIEGNVLRYLGLPGLDLLDLRHIHNAVCVEKNIHLRFLGFNDGANPQHEGQTELNVSLDEVKRLPFIDKASDVIPDNFCRLSNDNSIASQRARTLGPYHVVNLDLCDGFCAHPPNVLDETHYNALNSLLTLQSRSKEPWLLLLTTRAGETSIDPDVLAKLIARYSQNLTNNVFQTASRDLLKIGDQAALDQAVKTPEGKLPVFLVGLCKWFVGLAASQQPPTSVELKSIIGYRVEHSSKQVDLLSLALRFVPTFSPGPDPTGLALPQTQFVDEGQLAAKALKRVVKRVDADQVLQTNSKLYRQMADDMAGLLELARYDVNAWRIWETEEFNKSTLA